MICREAGVGNPVHLLAVVEQQLRAESNEAADLVLQKGSLSIAVEITVTTTVDHEFGNVKKCLAAGFTKVAVLSHREEHLKSIAQAVVAGLGPAASAKVGFYTPDDFIAELGKMAVEMKPDAPETAGERTTRGYKVRRHGPALTSDERKAKEDMAHTIMAEYTKLKNRASFLFVKIHQPQDPI